MQSNVAFGSRGFPRARAVCQTSLVVGMKIKRAHCWAWLVIYAERRYMGFAVAAVGGVDACDIHPATIVRSGYLSVFSVAAAVIAEDDG